MSTKKQTRLAIIGAGPIGLEAALRGVAAGMDVVVMDSGDVGSNVAAWGFVQMFTPWSMNTTPLGRRAAGDDPLFNSDARPTGQEFVEKYLIPIARCEPLCGRIDTGVRVLAVSEEANKLRTGFDLASDPGVPEHRFRLLVCDRFGTDQIDHADVVLDCSGTYGNSRWTGDGGLPAPGELGMKPSIWSLVPDVLGRDRERFADRHTLLVGTGSSAASILMSLSKLTQDYPETRVTWAFHRWGEILQLAADDPLPARRELVESALRLTSQPPHWLTLMEDAHIERYSTSHGKSAMLRCGKDSFIFHVDEIVSAVGYRADESIFADLCDKPEYAAAGETRNAVESELEAHWEVDAKMGLGHVVSVAPGYYLLGAKSYGINSSFLLRVGHQQVQAVFRELAGVRRPGENRVPAGSGRL